MSRVQSTAQLELDTFEGKKDVILGALQFAQCSINQNADFQILASRGSQVAFRAKGAMMANDVDYPIKIAVDFFSNAEKVFVNIAVDEDFGFGILTGAKGKYQGVCDRLRDTLAGAIVNSMNK